MKYSQAKIAANQARQSIAKLQARIAYFSPKNVAVSNDTIEGRLAQVKAWEAYFSPWILHHRID